MRSSDPNDTARAFLAALDAAHWDKAAALVHTDTVERFHEWYLEQLRRQDREGASDGLAETMFVRLSELVRVRDAAEAEALGPPQLLARFIAGVSPQNLYASQPTAQTAAAAERSEVRLVRALLRCSRGENDDARAEYRLDWYFGGRRNESMGGVHTLSLAWTSSGWRVRDADLGGHGTGHLMPPQAATAIDSAG
jgi:hypothetical protein